MRRIRRVLLACTLTLTTAATIATPALAAPAPAAPAGGASTPAAPTATYVVKEGDNLVGIARKLKVGFSELLAANSFTAASIIHPGDILLVPAAASVASSSTPSTAAAAGAPATTYVLASGDALYAVAAKFGVKLGPLLKANHLTLTSVVHPGQTLVIPAGGNPPKAVTTALPTTPATTPASVAESGSASTAIDKVIAFATAQLGKPWKFNAAGPDAFDCSGLTMMAYAEIDVRLPHQSALQATRGQAVDWHTEPIQAGDLVFMFTSGHPDVISHVGIAIDSKRWIHAPRAGDVVRIGMLPSADKIQAVRRYVD